MTSDKVVGINSGELWVGLHEDAAVETTVAAVRGVLATHPELGSDPVGYPEQRIDDLGPQTREPVVVRVYGEDGAALQAEAERVRERLTGVAGVVDARVRPVPQEPTVQIEVDLARAQSYGLKPGDVRRAAATLVAGIQVDSIFEEQKVFEVVVVGTPGTRDSLEDVRGLLIDAPGGLQVRLDQVADVRVSPAPVVLRHDAVSRYVDVTAGVSGRSAGDVAADARRDLAGLTMPVGYRVDVLDEQAGREAATTRVQLLFLAAAVVALLLLQAALASWRLAALLLLTLPLSVVGGALAAVAHTGAPARTTLLGLLAALGIAVRQGLVLLVRLGQVPPGLDRDDARARAAQGAEERLVPIAATVLGTAALLLPVLALGGVPGLEVARPLAVAVLGGLVSTTLVTLFVLPPLFLRLVPSADAVPAGPTGDPAADTGSYAVPEQRSPGQGRTDAYV